VAHPAGGHALFFLRGIAEVDAKVDQMNPFDDVRIVVTFVDGKTEYTPRMTRWWAEWLLTNEIASGFYKGRRVASALIVTV
jgi:hypothetical protein